MSDLTVNFFLRTRRFAIGGMESHALGFIESGKARGWKVNVFAADESTCEFPRADVFFFNDFGWFNDLLRLRADFPTAKFVLRSGGNDMWRNPDTVSTLNRCLDRLVVNSDFSYLRSISLRIDPRRIVKLRGGVPDGLIRVLAARRKRLRQEFDDLHGTSGRRILALVGRMEVFKGYRDALLALARNWDKSWFLVLAGGGRLDDEIRLLLQSHYLKSDYLHLGMLPHGEALRAIAISDVLLSPSRDVFCKLPFGEFLHTETMGRSMMEAMALGVDVIATEVGATSELAEEFPDSIRLVKSIEAIPTFLKSHVEAFSEFDGCVGEAYGWTGLMNAYESLFSGGSDDIYSFDYDGTLVGEGDDPMEVARFLRMHRGSSFMMMNTARSIDRDLLRFAEQAGMGCIIARNGMDIFDVSKGEHVRSWASRAEKWFQSDNTLSHVKNSFKKAFPAYRIEQPHVNSLVLRKSPGCGMEQRMALMSFIKGRPFHLCESPQIFKVVHDVFGKAGAAAYVLKDIVGRRRIVVAGNGLEDLDLRMCCDAFMAPRENETRFGFLEGVFRK